VGIRFSVGAENQTLRVSEFPGKASYVLMFLKGSVILRSI